MAKRTTTRAAVTTRQKAPPGKVYPMSPDKVGTTVPAGVSGVYVARIKTTPATYVLMMPTKGGYAQGVQVKIVDHWKDKNTGMLYARVVAAQKPPHLPVPKGGAMVPGPKGTSPGPRCLTFKGHAKVFIDKNPLPVGMVKYTKKAQNLVACVKWPYFWATQCPKNAVPVTGRTRKEIKGMKSYRVCRAVAVKKKFKVGGHTDTAFARQRARVGRCGR